METSHTAHSSTATPATQHQSAARCALRAFSVSLTHVVGKNTVETEVPQECKPIDTFLLVCAQLPSNFDRQPADGPPRIMTTRCEASVQTATTTGRHKNVSCRDGSVQVVLRGGQAIIAFLPYAPAYIDAKPVYPI